MTDALLPHLAMGPHAASAHAGPTAARPSFAWLEHVPQPAWIIRSNGLIDARNPAYLKFTGPPPATPEHWAERVHIDDRERVTAAWFQSQHSGDDFRCEMRLLHHSGEHRWVLVLARMHAHDADGSLLWCAVGSDIDAHVSAWQRLATRAQQRDEMLDVSVDCIKIIDTEGGVIHMNRSGCLALGVPVGETRFGMRWLDLLPPEIRARGQRALNRARRGQNARFAGKSVVGDNKPQYWDNILSPVMDPDGSVSSILCVSRDVTAEREAQDRLRQASEVDPLTDLLNRRAFKARLSRAVGRARQSGGQMGLLLMDLDHFKNVNDTLGHQAGDHLLRVLSRRVRHALPAGATIARLGGDEFAILIEDVGDEIEVCRVAQQVLRQLIAPITHSGRTINGGMSIGGAIYPRDACDPSALMTHADTALNDLKAGGRGGVRMFSERMTQAAEHAATQLQQARQIIRDNVIEPHYQPKVNLADGCIVGFEALLRWRDDAGRIQLPGAVAGAFKDYALAAGLAGRIHTQVLRDLAHWRDQGLPLLPVSINAAPVEFMRDDFAQRLLRRLDEFQIPPSLIEIEVTEHILLERCGEFVASALRLLKQHGVRIALDDFGTGHSSFAHLRDYPVDIVKIDRSFVHKMGSDPIIRAIVEAITRLGPSLAVDVIAEGIETEAQRRMLRAAGCGLGQGFLFSTAVSAESVADLLGTGREATRLVGARRWADAAPRPGAATPPAG